jgi:hypothetical protein
MTSNKKPILEGDNIQPVPESAPAEPPPAGVPSSTDIFNDLGALREQSKLTVRRRSMLTNVFVVKHPDNSKHFRVHPDEGMTLAATVLFDDSRNCYYVIPGMRSHPKLVKRLRYVSVHLAVLWPEQQPVLWPVPIAQGNDFAVWRSYRKAAELAKENWIQMTWDDGKRDFAIETAENIPHQPQWPTESFSELLKIAFEGRVIDNEDHEYVQILRGLAE